MLTVAAEVHHMLCCILSLVMVLVGAKAIGSAVCCNTMWLGSSLLPDGHLTCRKSNYTAGESNPSPGRELILFDAGFTVLPVCKDREMPVAIQSEANLHSRLLKQGPRQGALYELKRGRVHST